MSGIVVIDRRDLERLLKALVHEQKRDDVKVDVKFYVAFSNGDDYSVQTIVEPWQPLSRSKARDLVKAAIGKLNEEDVKSQAQKALTGPATAETIPATEIVDSSPIAGPKAGPEIEAFESEGGLVL